MPPPPSTPGQATWDRLQRKQQGSDWGETDLANVQLHAAPLGGWRSPAGLLLPGLPARLTMTLTLHVACDERIHSRIWTATVGVSCSRLSRMHSRRPQRWCHGAINAVICDEAARVHKGS